MRKFIRAYLLLSIVLIFSFSGVVYVIFSEGAFQTIRLEALETAETVAEVVDFSGHELLLEEDDSEGENYKRIFSDLNDASRLNPDVEFVYTMRPRTNGEWEFVVDAALEIDENQNGQIDEDEASADIGEFYDTNCCPELAEALIKPSADKTVTRDVWGSWISGYAPIHGTNGEVIGIIGVDISANELLEDLRLLRLIMFVVIGITLILTALFGVIAYTFFTEESSRIQDKLKIKNGQLEKLVIERSTELAMNNLTLIKYLERCTSIISSNRGVISLDGKTDVKKVDSITSDISEKIQLHKTVSDIQLGRLKVQKELSDFDLMMRFILLSFEEEAGKKNIKIKTNISNWIGVCKFDKKRITAVAETLISNAMARENVSEISVNASVDNMAKTISLEVVDDGSPVLTSEDQAVGSDTHLKKVILEGVMRAHGGEYGSSTSKSGKNIQWISCSREFVA